MAIMERNIRGVASELFASAVCNLDCDYCYIPKTKRMGEYHKQLLRALDDGSFITRLQAGFGDKLRHIGLWGTEPTLILDKLTEHLDDYFEAFPELNAFGFSSNLKAYPERIVEFTRALENVGERYDREITFTWQVSLDGDAWLTDVSRNEEGITERIIENAKTYFRLMSEHSFSRVRTNFSFKATVPLEAMEQMIEDFHGRFIGWYRFFDDLFGAIVGILEGGKWRGNIVYNNSPTLVVPGKYSTEDGRVLATFFEYQRRLHEMYLGDQGMFEHIKPPFNGYVFRLRDVISESQQFSIQPFAGTCSGGDSSFGLDMEGDLHLCHRTFLFNDDHYVEQILEPSRGIDDWSVSKFQQGIVANIRRYLTANVEDTEEEQNRYLYLLRGYHDNLGLKVSSTVSMLRELALAGQADRVYLEDDRLAELLALFLNTRMSCPAENFLQSGSIYLTPVSVARLWANGAFQALLKSYFLWKGERSL